MQQNNYSPYTINVIPPDTYERAGVRRTAFFVGILLLMYFGISKAVGSFFGIVYVFVNSYFSLSPSLNEIFYQIINMLSYIVGITLPFIIYLLIVKIPLKFAIPLKRPRASLAIPAIPITLGLSVVGIIVASVFVTFFETFGLSYNVPLGDTPQSWVARILYIIYLSVLPAIFEEITCRGILMQSLRRHGDLFALVVSSIIFSLLHGNFMQIPNAFVLGLAFGFFALRTNSLITSILMHFFNNFLVSIFDMFVTQNLSEMEIALANLALLGVYVIIGVIGFVFVLVKHKNIFSLSKGYGVMKTSAKLGAFFTHPLLIVGTVVMLVLCFSFFLI